MKPSETLSRLTMRSNIPLICVLELTRRCNLRCRHCYIDHYAAGRDAGLSTREVKSILRQLAEAGTLNLVFTGGEVFLRPDLLELCRYARKLSFDLRIFTNGTLLGPVEARALAAMDASAVEISLYGRKAAHEKITASPGSFDAAVRAVRLLKAHGIKVVIKCPLMRSNFADLDWIRTFAEKEGIIWRVDPTIAPLDTGSRNNLDNRLTRRQMKELYSRPGFAVGETPLDGDELPCSAGKNLATIASDGTVYPCLQLLLPLGNVKEQPFSAIWSGHNPALASYRDIRFSDLRECRSCAHASRCQRCPGFAFLEEGDLFGPSRIACSIAALNAFRSESPADTAKQAPSRP